MKFQFLFKWLLKAIRASNNILGFTSLVHVHMIITWKIDFFFKQRCQE